MKSDIHYQVISGEKMKETNKTNGDQGTVIIDSSGKLEKQNGDTARVSVGAQHMSLCRTVDRMLYWFES